MSYNDPYLYERMLRLRQQEQQTGLNPSPTPARPMMFSQPLSMSAQDQQNNDTEDSDSPQLEEPPKSDPSKYMDEYEKLMGAPSPMMKRYQEYLNHMPQRQDYKPGVLGRIAAAVSGFGEGVQHGAGAGIQTAQMVLDRPYQQAYQDYMGKMGPMKEMADIEHEDLAGKIRYLTDAQKMGLQYSDFAEKKRHNLEAESANRDKQKDYVRISGLKNHQYKALADGGILDYDPETKNSTIIPARTVEQAQTEYRNGMLGVAKSNAATNARRATTAEKEAGTREKVAGSTIEKNEREKIATPQAQLAAREVVFQEMKRNPKFSKFIVPDKNAPGYSTAVTDDNSQEYYEFNQEFKKRYAAALKKGSAVLPPDDDIEIIKDGEEGG